MSKTIHNVSLPEKECALLQKYVFTGVHSARSIKGAQILLGAVLFATSNCREINLV
jgi:hypothetical protein